MKKKYVPPNGACPECLPAEDPVARPALSRKG